MGNEAKIVDPATCATLPVDDFATATTEIGTAIGRSFQVEKARATLLSLVSELPGRLMALDELTLTPNGTQKESPAQRLYEFLLAGIQIQPSPADTSEYEPPAGSLSPTASGHCIFDYVRTKRFFEAITAHVHDLCADKTTGDIHVVDAGCGSIPILSIAAALASPRVKVLAIENTPDSLDIARSIVAKFGIENQIEFIEADAKNITLETPPDLIVSETLYTGFVEETFIGIMNNLAPQLAVEGRTVPEKVDIEYALVDSEPLNNLPWEVCYFPGIHKLFASFPTIDFQTCFTWSHEQNVRKINLPFELDIEAVKRGEIDRFYIRSSMSLYKKRNGQEPVQLLPDESIITETHCFTSLRASVLELIHYDDRLVASKLWQCSLEYWPGAGHESLFSYKAT